MLKIFNFFLTLYFVEMFKFCPYNLISAGQIPDFLFSPHSHVSVTHVLVMCVVEVNVPDMVILKQAGSNLL